MTERQIDVWLSGGDVDAAEALLDAITDTALDWAAIHNVDVTTSMRAVPPVAVGPPFRFGSVTARGGLDPIDHDAATRALNRNIGEHVDRTFRFTVKGEPYPD